MAGRTRRQATRTTRQITLFLRSFAIGFRTLGLALVLAAAPLGLGGVLDGCRGKAALAMPADETGSGQALDPVRSDAVSGMSPSQAKQAIRAGLGGDLGLKGSFNAIHASVPTFQVVSSSSRVETVRAYLDASQTVSAVETGEVMVYDLDAAVQAAAEAAAATSSQSVTKEMLEAVQAYADARELADIDIGDETSQEIADRTDRDVMDGGETAAGESDAAE